MSKNNFREKFPLYRESINATFWKDKKIIQANIYQVIKLYWLEKCKDLKKVDKNKV